MKPSLDIIIKEKLQAFASESMQDIKENTEKKKWNNLQAFSMKQEVIESSKIKRNAASNLRLASVTSRSNWIMDLSKQ